MKSIRNSVQLIGYLGGDPELKTTKRGGHVARFSLATTIFFRNSQGERVEDTQWHNIVVWGKLGEHAARYLKKGKEVAIEGRLVYRSYETQEGSTRYVSEINANDVIFLGSNKETQASA